MELPNSTYSLHGTDNKKYIISNHLESVDLCMRFMKEVLYGADSFFKTMQSSGNKTSTVTKLGQNLRYLNNYSKLYDSHYIFHPTLAFFFAEYRAHEIKKCVSYPHHQRMPNGKLVSAIFDDFVVQMRKNAVEKRLKKTIADWESKTKKNLERTLEFEEKLFERAGRLAVIRLDLEHRSATFDLAQIDEIVAAARVKKAQEHDDLLWTDKDISNPEPMKGVVPIEEVQRDREHLFRNMKGKPSLFEHLVGYIWRIECTPHAGYHLHLALFFNGANVQKHAHLAQQIGEYWNNEITHGRGRFHNCNMHWNKNAPTYGIGVINHYEQAKRANLRAHVLAYLSKTTQRVQVMPYKGCNLFGSGFAHRDHSKGRGRHRTKGANPDNQPASLAT